MSKYLYLVAAMALLLPAGLLAKGEKKAPEGKVTVVITHEVKDYATWRKGFDADKPNRMKAGFKVSGVYADVSNPNMVTIIGEFPSSAAANGFATSPKLKEAMDKAGVISKPEVKILTPRHM
jgi:hypothetical protein